MADRSQDCDAYLNSTLDQHHALEVQEPSLSALKDSLAQPGLEVTPAHENDKHLVNNDDQGEKQVFNHEEKEVVPSNDKPGGSSVPTDWHGYESHKPNTSRRICGMKRTLFWTLLIAVLLVTALAVGLGAGLSSRQSGETSSTSPTSHTASPTTSPTPVSSATPTTNELLQIGGSIDPSYYTKSGAWNGSGIAYIWQNFTQGWDDILATNEYSHVVYFQHYSGEIHWMRQTLDFSWKEGPQDLLVVATDARNSTPISAVQYTSNGTNYWNVFYIDSDDHIRQRSGNNRTTGWTEGSISEARLTAWNGDLVGLAACDSAINESIPIRLFYASNSTSFEEYLWKADEDEWVWQQTWPDYSAAAGVGCHTGVGYNRYVGLVRPSNRLEFWYQPTDDIQADWQKAEYEVPNVHPASSLSFTREHAFYQENGTNAMLVAEMNWHDFDTRTGNYASSPASGLSGSSGTRMSAMQNGDYTWMFYQRNGRDVTWLERAPDANRWQVKTPIPFS